MSRILPLSAETISQIHSSKQITNLQDVVLGLLENSLDAGSNRVEITVDFRRGGCTVEDNGIGIPSAEFLPTGGLGHMYHTSKRGSVGDDEVHGSAGIYLASLAALSLLRIISVHTEESQQATLTFHHGKVIARQVLATSTSKNFMATTRGTNITVRDLFGNMPVRIKQRALAANASSDHAKAWQHLHLLIVALLLAWPKPCLVRLADEDNERSTLQLSARYPKATAALTRNTLDTLNGAVAKCNLIDALAVLYQARLATPESRRRWIPASASTPDISIKGVICLDPAPTKQCQFISIGIRPCFASPSTDDLCNTINRAFINSSFGAMDDDSDLDIGEKDRRKHDRRFRKEGFVQKQLRGRKGIDHCPMFALNIRFKADRIGVLQLDRLNDSTLKVVGDILETMVTQWLSANHLRPRNQRQRQRKESHSPTSASPSKRSLPTDLQARPRPNTPAIESLNDQSVTTSKKRKFVDITGHARIIQEEHSDRPLGASSHFDSWSQIRSGRGAFYDELWQAKTPAMAPAGQSGTIAAEDELRPFPAFNLPPLDAGAFSVKKPAIRKAFATTRGTRNPLGQRSTALNQCAPSSEDYGSCSDDEVLAAVGATERTQELLDSHQERLDNEAAASLAEGCEGYDEYLEWKDPVSKQVFKINARTGVVLPAKPRHIVSVTGETDNSKAGPRHSVAINNAISSFNNPLSLARRPKTSSGGGDKPLPGFLKDWKNPVFVRQEEERITTACSHELSVDAAELVQDPAASALLSDAATCKISKAALCRAKVIAQVDHKYILCAIGASDPSLNDETLVLVDQHAASERVILEELFAELCTPTEQDDGHAYPAISTLRLDRPIQFDVSEMEYEYFGNHKAHFAIWGICYDVREQLGVLSASQVRTPKTYYTIVVQILPKGIAERCKLVPKLLIELLRSEIWSIVESNKTTRHRPTTGLDGEDVEHSWLNRIGSCPKGIIEMLNSRACRSAIMFNDKLSIAECERLLSDLSKCAFPFMCAHGRVSMVPISNVGTSQGGLSDWSPPNAAQSSGERFVEAFRDWKARDRDGRRHGASP